jgi:very-short-patch-repair endonuclease
MGRKLTQEEYIEQVTEVHDSKYDYSKVKYVGANKNIEIICPEHGPFWQRASNHKSGRGCDDCGDVARLIYKTKKREQFIKDARAVHGDTYRYDFVEYVNANKVNVTITCKIHGNFPQLPTHHLNGHGCSECKKGKISKALTMSQKEFITIANQIHNFKYDYTKTEVKGSHEYLTVICPLHDEWSVLQTNHLSGYGCPKCLNKAEGRICEYLLKKDVVVREHSINKKRYDFYLPKLNLLIERDGQQHYKDTQIYGGIIKIKDQQKNDKYKTKIAKEKGFKIARIPYWLTKKEEEIEIENILAGKPTYPDIPDLKQEKTKPKPVKNF